MTLVFDEMLELIADRSAALRDAVVAAGDMEARVPGCPDWAVRDLVTHLSHVQRSWAQVVRAQDTEVEWEADAPPESATLSALLDWSAEATRLLTDALHDVGPHTACQTWWGLSDAPEDSGAVARHQVQEAAVHAYDAQSAAGDPQTIPTEVALDGVEEFLIVSFGAMGAWPHPDTRVGFTAAEGPAWTLDMTSKGAKLVADATATATITAPASDLLLTLYSRIPLTDLRVEGDRAAAEQLVTWVRTATQ